MKIILLILSVLYIDIVLCFIPPFPDLPIGIISEDNEVCTSHSKWIRSSLENNTLWAFQIWDSSAKDSSGISNGRLYQLGHYEECLNIKKPIKTKYCLIDLKINSNITIIDPYTIQYDPYSDFYQKILITQDRSKTVRNIAHVGLCIPDSCSYKNTETYLQKYVNENNKQKEFTYDITVEYENCQSDENVKQYSTKDVLYGFSVITIIILSIIGTVIDLIYKENNEEKQSTIIKTLLCFSIPSNIKELHLPDKNIALHPIYIIRSLLMIYILNGHSGIFTYAGPIYDYTGAESFTKNIMDMLRSRTVLVIDMFFVMGGLLATYNYLSQSQLRIINPMKSIFIRYLRFVPVFAFMTFFYATWYTKINSGPVWNKVVGSEAKYCQTSWWANLLLINNYVNVENSCMLQGWYIAVDFQLFVITFPLKILLKKNEKLGLQILGFSFLIFALIPGLVVYYYNTGPFLYTYLTTFQTFRTDKAWKYLYVPFHTRGASYVIGMLFGYIYYKLKSVDFKIPKMTSYILIISCFTTMATCMFTAFKFYNSYIKYTPLEAALYASIHRPVFAFCFAVLLIVWSHTEISICFMKNVLPLYFFVPFSKLTYGIYMVHMMFQYMRAGSVRTASTDDFYLSTTFVLAEIIYSTLTSFVLFLIVENPPVKLIKILLSSDSKIKQKKQL